jgi:large subunit ribosomal protein L15
MSNLSTLQNSHRPKKKRKNVGRGNGCGFGKTCGRGYKGAGSRSGYKRRLGYEGGQFRLFMKLPHRGFSNAQFRTTYEIVNLYEIENAFSDGDVVNLETLKAKGLLSSRCRLAKVLSEGELTKKVKIEVQAISAGAREKLQKANISFTLES